MISMYKSSLNNLAHTILWAFFFISVPIMQPPFKNTSMHLKSLDFWRVSYKIRMKLTSRVLWKNIIIVYHCCRSITPVAAESFLECLQQKGLFLHNGALPDLTKDKLDTATKNYGSLDLTAAPGRWVWVFFPICKQLCNGIILGGGYKHHTIKKLMIRSWHRQEAIGPTLLLAVLLQKLAHALVWSLNVSISI